MTDDLDQWVIDYLADICAEDQIDNETLVSAINENQLFKSQMEALIVAFELVWKLAKVSFVDENKAASAERTGGVRRHIVVGANRTVFSPDSPTRSCRAGTYRTFLPARRHVVIALFERQHCCF